MFCFKVRHEKTAEIRRFFSAGDERIELPLRVLETPVIPFDQSPFLVPVTVLTYITFWAVMSSILYCLTTEAVVYSNKFNNSYKVEILSLLPTARCI